MKSHKLTANCGVDLMGVDFYATIDFTFAPGSPAYWERSSGLWLPPDPPEWEITNITLQRDEPGYLGPKWELDGSMFDVITELTCVNDAIMEAGE